MRDPLPQDDRVAVLGLGRSGLAAARLLARHNKTLILSDSREDLDTEAILAGFPEGTQLFVGENNFGGAKVAVISPGISLENPIIKQAHILGVELVGALELGARALDTPVVAITGTDGKTTTTSITADLLRASGYRVTVAGNIGVPLCEVIDEANASDVVVLEVSAFQLWSARTLRPRVLIATNIAEDHVAYFLGDVDAYIHAKSRPLQVMESSDAVILNAEDPIVRDWSNLTRARPSWYALNPKNLPPQATRSAFIEGEEIFIQNGRNKRLVIEERALSLVGPHNRLNVMAAALGAAAFGARVQNMRAPLRTFKTLPHRIEAAGTVEGISFINDSKATNPHAAIAGLQSAPAPIILIAGGVDKKLQLDAWINVMSQHTVAVVLIGELAPRLRELIEAANAVDTIFDAESMQEAVSQALALAREKEALSVLLSPGCSSFDMFQSYGARGDVFKAAVAALPRWSEADA